MAAANDSGVASVTHPVESSTISARPPRPVVTTGLAWAKASGATRPNGSFHSEGTRTARAAARWSPIWSGPTWPTHSTVSSASAAARTSPAASPSPTMRRVAPTSRGTRGHASSSRRTPLYAASRPAKTNIRPAAGSAGATRAAATALYLTRTRAGSNPADEASHPAMCRLTATGTTPSRRAVDRNTELATLTSALAAAEPA